MLAVDLIANVLREADDDRAKGSLAEDIIEALDAAGYKIVRKSDRD